MILLLVDVANEITKKKDLYMALFGSRKGEKKNYFNVATIITEGTTTVGNLIGNDSIHIDGHIKGDVKVNNVVIVGKSGVIDGNIKAQQVISSGTCNGNIICDSLELMDSSSGKTHIKANKVLIKGHIKGSIICNGLFATEGSLIEANIQAKNITTSGTILGMLSAQVLKIMNTSCIKGKIFADRIINQGGHVEGFIGKYSELIAENPQLEKYGAILNSRTEIALLQHSDYHVDVEKEIEANMNNTKNNNNDDSFIDVEFDIKDESKLFEVG